MEEGGVLTLEKRKNKSAAHDTPGSITDTTLVPLGFTVCAPKNWTSCFLLCVPLEKSCVLTSKLIA